MKKCAGEAEEAHLASPKSAAAACTKRRTNTREVGTVHWKPSAFSRLRSMASMSCLV